MLEANNPSSLSVIDNKLMDGLRFCTKVYDLYERIRSEPEGIKRIRLISSKLEKRLAEELFPIAQYIQLNYRAGNRFKVRWLSGSQPYDAVLWTPVIMVRHTNTPRKIYLEVTTSVHPKAHLVRKELHEKGGSFGPKQIRTNKKTGQISSSPHLYSGGSFIGDLAQQIIERLKAKSAKAYPINTVLLVNCYPDTLILEREWAQAVDIVRSAELHKNFREVVLLDARGHNWSTLWGGRC